MGINPTRSVLNNPPEILEFPTNFKPLGGATLLYPCLDIIPQHAAEIFYGMMIEEKERVEREGPCILCLKKVTAYKPIRSSVALSPDKTEEIEPKNSAKIETDFKEKSEQEFPEKGAIFEKANWKKHDPSTSLKRSLLLPCANLNANPTLTRLEVVELSNGTVVLYIGFKKENSEIVASDLSKLGIKINDVHAKFGYFACTRDEARRLFNHVAENNKIPKEIASDIRSLLEAGESEPRSPFMIEKFFTIFKDHILGMGVISEADLKENSAKYPGNKAKFEKAQWKTLDLENVPLVWNMILKCTNLSDNPLITRIQIIGNRDGSVFLELSFEEENQEIIAKYLSEYGIKLKEPFASLGCPKWDANEAINVFNIINRNNEIPEEDRSLIDSLLKAKN